jgi:hypothetical protein
VAPGDGVAHRAKAGGQVARPADEQRQPPRQPGQQRARRQQANPRRRQLDGQRQPVEAGADGGHGRRVGLGEAEIRARRPGAFGEQADRLISCQLLRQRQAGGIRKRERRHREGLLAVEVEDGPARDEHREVGRGGEQVADQRGGRQHLLEVVEDQQQGPPAKVPLHALGHRPVARLAHAEGLRDRRGDEVGVADRSEGDEGDTGDEVRGEGLGHPQGQARLADAAGAGQGQEADAVVTEQGADRGGLAFPPDQRRQRNGEVGGGRGRRCGHRVPRLCAGGRRINAMMASGQRVVNRMAALAPCPRPPILQRSKHCPECPFRVASMLS